MRGLNDFNLSKCLNSRTEALVSVPMRGLNDFNENLNCDQADGLFVSVPMGGLNDFNPAGYLLPAEISLFPSPCGV